MSLARISRGNPHSKRWHIQCETDFVQDAERIMERYRESVRRAQANRKKNETELACIHAEFAMLGVRP